MFYPLKHHFFILLIVLLCSLIFTACTPPTPETTAVISPTTTTDLETPTSPPPPRESSSPTPILTQSLVVFVSPPDADPTASDQIAQTLSELAAGEGLKFDIRPSFNKDDLTAEIRILAAFEQDPGLVEMAQTAPAIQFLGISIPGLEPSANISVIESQGIDEGDIGFLAGYLAAVVSPEWRIGTISISDTPAGQDQRQGFLNGAVFFCGLCQQIFPPFLNYPLFGEAPGASNTQEWLAIADILIESAVDTAYIAPGVGDESLYEYLAGAEINLIGSAAPPPGLEDNWIGTIGRDFQSAVQAAWPGLLTERGDAQYSAQLMVTNINPALLSPGRQRLVEKMIAEMSAGLIDTGVGEGVSSP